MVIPGPCLGAHNEVHGTLGLSRGTQIWKCQATQEHELCTPEYQDPFAGDLIWNNPGTAAARGRLGSPHDKD